MASIDQTIVTAGHMAIIDQTEVTASHISLLLISLLTYNLQSED